MTRISLAERGAQIKRKLDAGLVVPAGAAMRNEGRRRTADKAALLDRLRCEAERQQRPLPFTARY